MDRLPVQYRERRAAAIPLHAPIPVHGLGACARLDLCSQSRFPSQPRAAMPAYQYIYVMKGLSKTYPGGREVLKDIWLSFLPGAKIGVLGANGAGKSTLLKIMAGIEKDYAGEAWA